MKNILTSRSAAWAAAILIGSGLGGMRAQPTVAAVQQPPKAGPPAVRYIVAADGNEARYRVREELAGMDFPNDAIGATKSVSGGIVFDDKGVIIRDSSKFVIDLSTLKSDKPRRDNFIRGNTLETEKYPTATFVPFELRGLPAKLPKSGTLTFQVAGQLTIRGVPRFTVWNVTATAGDDVYTGTAKTAFVFDDFQMEQPAVPVVLSVNDTIKLEYDFKLAKTAK
jgi:polyisoprenoid-binding protein YceI